jgi:hypothetical protein
MELCGEGAQHGALFGGRRGLGEGGEAEEVVELGWGDCFFWGVGGGVAGGREERSDGPGWF